MKWLILLIIFSSVEAGQLKWIGKFIERAPYPYQMTRISKDSLKVSFKSHRLMISSQNGNTYFKVLGLNERGIMGFALNARASLEDVILSPNFEIRIIRNDVQIEFKDGLSSDEDLNRVLIVLKILLEE